MILVIRWKSDNWPGYKRYLPLSVDIHIISQNWVKNFLISYIMLKVHFCQESFPLIWFVHFLTSVEWAEFCLNDKSKIFIRLMNDLLYLYNSATDPILISKWILYESQYYILFHNWISNVFDVVKKKFSIYSHCGCRNPLKQKSLNVNVTTVV